jgi:hypothetical protein
MCKDYMCSLLHQCNLTLNPNSRSLSPTYSKNPGSRSSQSLLHAAATPAVHMRLPLQSAPKSTCRVLRSHRVRSPFGVQKVTAQHGDWPRQSHMKVWQGAVIITECQTQVAHNVRSVVCDLFGLLLFSPLLQDGAAMPAV